MYIIKLNAIDSTNTYLKEMVSAGIPDDYTVVVTESQEEGRGQNAEADRRLPENAGGYGIEAGTDQTADPGNQGTAS